MTFYCVFIMYFKAISFYPKSKTIFYSPDFKLLKTNFFNKVSKGWIEIWSSRK